MNTNQLAEGLRNSWNTHRDREEALKKATDASYDRLKQHFDEVATAIGRAMEEQAHAPVLSDVLDVPAQKRRVTYGLSTDDGAKALKFDVEISPDKVSYQGHDWVNDQLVYHIERMNDQVYETFKAPERRRG